MPGYSRFVCLTSAVEVGDVITTAEAPLFIPTVRVDRLRFLRESAGTLIRRSRATFSRGEKGAGTIPVATPWGQAFKFHAPGSASFGGWFGSARSSRHRGGVHANMIMNVCTAFRASSPSQPARATGKFWDTSLRRRS